MTTLSVDVPGETTQWLLTGDGHETSARLLALIAPDVAMWEAGADLSASSPACHLWNAISDHKGMGRTKTSKLLAAKRPHLIPIFDNVLEKALLRKRSDNDWELWNEYLSGPEGAGRRNAAREVRDAAGINPQLSILRIYDMVLWMTFRGADSTT